MPTWILDVFVVGYRVLAVVVPRRRPAVAFVDGQWRELVTVALGAGIALVASWSPSSTSSHPSPRRRRGRRRRRAGAAVLGHLPHRGRRGRHQRRPHRRRPLAEPALAAVSWALVVGLVFTRFLVSAISFDSLRAVVIGWVAGAAVLVVLGARSRRPTGPAIADRAGRGRRAARSAWSRPASTPAGSTPYFGRAADGRRTVRQGARAGPAQRRPAVPASTASCSPGTSATSGPSPRLRRARRARGARGAGRPGPRHPHAAAGRLRHRRAQRLRAGLRGHRGPLARPRRARRDDRRGAGRDLGRGAPTSAGTASPTATCGWPTSSWPPTARSG